MVDISGFILSTIGILLIIISFYFLNLITTKHLKKEGFKIYFYLAIIFMAIFIGVRTYSIFYSDYLTTLGLAQDVLVEKILFLRMLVHMPFAIAITLLLIICYEHFLEIKYKSTKLQ